MPIEPLQVEPCPFLGAAALLGNSPHTVYEILLPDPQGGQGARTVRVTGLETMEVGLPDRRFQLNHDRDGVK